MMQRSFDSSGDTLGGTSGASPGKVWFIGAGPGDPELLTVKGRRLIRTSLILQ